MTQLPGIRSSDIELRWGASPLTAAIATAAAAGLAAAVAGSRWQLLAFVAPLLGVLCSIHWQPAAPRVRVHAQPGLQRCFESEPARFSIWPASEPGGVPVRLGVGADPALDVVAADHTGPTQAVTVTAARWGRYPIRARVELTARGGLLAGAASVEVAEVGVFPLAPPQSTLMPRTELLDRLGTHLTRHTGRGVEYAGIRAYVPGDPLRAVNWSVSARRRSLFVTQRLTDRSADVVVIVDTSAQPRGPATRATERTVRGVAQVVQSALRSGDRAGIILLGDRRPRWLGADIGQRQFYRVLDTVLGFSDTPNLATGTLAPRAAVPVGAIVVGFSTLLDTEFALALIDLRRRGHVVLAVDVLPTAPFDVTPDPLMARMWTLERAGMYRDMATVGVDVVHWPEDHPLEQAMRLAAGRRRPVRGAVR